MLTAADQKAIERPNLALKYVYESFAILQYGIFLFKSWLGDHFVHRDHIHISCTDVTFSPRLWLALSTRLALTCTRNIKAKNFLPLSIFDTSKTSGILRKAREDNICVRGCEDGWYIRLLTSWSCRCYTWRKLVWKPLVLTTRIMKFSYFISPCSNHFDIIDIYWINLTVFWLAVSYSAPYYVVSFSYARDKYRTIWLSLNRIFPEWARFKAVWLND